MGEREGGGKECNRVACRLLAIWVCSCFLIDHKELCIGAASKNLCKCTSIMVE